MSPEAILFKISESFKALGLIKIAEENQPLLRIRIKDSSWEVHPDQLKQPPNEKAKSGRMNPAGISFFYAAEDIETAVKETWDQKSAAEAAVGKFKTITSLNLLDLTNLPDVPSTFDIDNTEVLSYIMFLKGFIRDISQPVEKDGREHIDYVPTQIISELIANKLEHNGNRVDGIQFPSSVNLEGKNWVLFPRAFEKVELENIETIKLELPDDA